MTSSESENEDLEGLEDSSESDNDEDILGSKEPDYGMPDARAWGKKSKTYHSTDYIDPDFGGGFDGSDAEMAELEEQEARDIQKRLKEELTEQDFLGFLPAPKSSEKTDTKATKSKEVLKIDVDSLSAAEKRKILERECPEVIHMVEEYKGTFLVFLRVSCKTKLLLPTATFSFLQIK